LKADGPGFTRVDGGNAGDNLVPEGEGFCIARCGIFGGAQGGDHLGIDAVLPDQGEGGLQDGVGLTGPGQNRSSGCIAPGCWVSGR